MNTIELASEYNNNQNMTYDPVNNTNRQDMGLTTMKTFEPAKTALHYLFAAMFFALFGGVYEAFSHGVFSFYMLYAFAFPLVLGVFPYLLLHVKKVIGRPGFFARTIYGVGIAILTIGSVVSGILEIYGTTNDLTNIYWIAGVAFFLIGAIVGIKQTATR